MKCFRKRQETVLKGHLYGVTCVAVTSDYKYIISGSLDSTIRIWNFLEKKQKSVLKGHLDGIKTLAVTSDNKYIISCSFDRTIRIWSFLKKQNRF